MECIGDCPLIVFRLQAIRVRFSLFSLPFIFQLGCRFNRLTLLYTFLFLCPVSVFYQLGGACRYRRVSRDNLFFIGRSVSRRFYLTLKRLLVLRTSFTNTIPIMYVTIASMSMPDQIIRRCLDGLL